MTVLSGSVAVALPSAAEAGTGIPGAPTSVTGTAAADRRGASVGSAPLRVSLPSEAMVVGDSISQGSAGDFTWRYRFDKHETAVGAELSLVGPRDDLFDNVAHTWNDNHTYADPAFGRRHGALWGESYEGAAARIGGDIAAYHPDYLLVLLGLHDLGTGGPAVAEANLRTFIANARTADPEMRFVFGTLLPSQRALDDAGYAAAVADFNARLRRTTGELSTADSRIHVAETGRDISPPDDLWDGTHPNAQGEVKIAAAFADSLAAGESIGAPYPRPYPSVPLGPRVAPQLSATPGNWEAALSWTLSPGATGYYVHTKDVTAGETTFTRLPYPVAGPAWTAGLLTNGHTYEFQLKAVKGTAEGAFSNVATVTPAGPAPNAVTDLAAAPGAGSATLSWTPVANATGYYVFRRNVTAGETAFTALPWPVSGSLWVAELLIPGATYQFRLQAANGDVRGGMSNTATTTVTEPVPAAVTNLTAAPAGVGEATLSWTRVANATGYYVHVKNLSAGETTFTRLPWPVAGPTWASAGLVPGARYQYRVQPVNGYLLGGLSNTASVTAPAPRSQVKIGS